MDLTVDAKALFQLLQDYYAVTRLRVGIYDLHRREVCAFPVRHSGFCKIIRASERGLALCGECDRRAFEQAGQSGEVYIYCCHAGLTEAVAPLRDQNEIIGYMMIGQMRGADEEAQWQRLEGSLAALGTDVRYLRGAFHQLRSVTEAEVRSCSHILQACAAYIRQSRFVQARRAELPKKLEQYLEENLAEPLRLNVIAARLGVGKTTLCACARQSFGMTVGELVARRRVERARELLRKSESSIAEVAAQVGVPDYNYFSKLFKAQTGQTPRAWRAGK